MQSFSLKLTQVVRWWRLKFSVKNILSPKQRIEILENDFDVMDQEVSIDVDDVIEFLFDTETSRLLTEMNPEKSRRSFLLITNPH